MRKNYMHDSPAVPPARTRQQIEDELLSEVQLRRAEFEGSVDGARIAAREQFAVALKQFNGFILSGTPPNE